MKKKLTIEDLPKEVVEKMEEAVREDPIMIELEQKKKEYIRKKMYVQSQKIKQKMDEVVKKTINDYLSTYEGEAVRMDELLKDMSSEDREEFNVLSNSIIMLCDMIETFSMDCNEILQKYHPEYRLEMYEKIVDIGKEAKVQMDFMTKNTDSIYQCTFAGYADDITELIKNKAKSLIRKLRSKSTEKHD